MATRTGTIFVLNFDPRPVPSGDIWIEVPGEYDQATNTRRFKFKVGTGQTAYKYLPYGLIGEETAAPASTGGNMVGPASSTDNALVRWDGTTGKLTQNSVIVVSDLGAITGILSLNGNTFGPTPGVLIVQGNALTLLSSGAAAAGQVATADGAGNITWVTPTAGTGDVVGPASAVDGHIVQFDGVTGKLIKDGLATSAGGNGTADSGKVPVFGADGSLSVANTGGSGSALLATSDVAFLPAVNALSNGSGPAGAFYNSSTGDGVNASANDGYAVFGLNDSITAPAGHFQNVDPTKTGDLGQFHNADDDGLIIENDGGLDWTTPTGAQSTATNLPVFSALKKGVVPAAGAVPSATKFLDETGAWAVPPDTDTGITQLTGDVTAGPGSGSQAATLASVITAGGPTGSASVVPVITYDAKGRLTAVSTATITPAAIGAPAGSGTSTGTNTGDQTNISGNAATVTTNANLTGPVTSVGNATTIADPELAAIAALTSAADKTIQFTGSGTAALVNLKEGPEAAYTGTITWTAGAAPSGASSLRQFYTQVGNQVSWQISLTYANTGTTVTNVVLTFPTEFPTPAIPSGFTGASVRLYSCDNVRLLSTPTGSLANATGFFVMRNAADTGFDIKSTGTFASGSYRTFIFGGTYFTS